MKIGIDKMAFATTDEYIDLRELARERGDEPDKYTIGIGQDRQAVVPPSHAACRMFAFVSCRPHATQ